MASYPMTTVVAAGLDPEATYSDTYERFRVIGIQNGLGPGAAEEYARAQADKFHNLDGAPSGDIPPDPEFPAPRNRFEARDQELAKAGLRDKPEPPQPKRVGGVELRPSQFDLDQHARDMARWEQGQEANRRAIRSAGYSTTTVPGPRLAGGSRASAPRQLNTIEEAEDYATRPRATPGEHQPAQGDYLLSPMDQDMLARGFVPVYNRDGSVSYAPGSVTGTHAGGFRERGGVGRAGRRPDLEAKGWRLVEEEGPTGLVYVYRPQPPETRNKLATEDEAVIGRPAEAPRSGMDVYWRGPIVQYDLDAVAGGQVPASFQGRVPPTRTGNTFVDSQNARNDRMIRRLAEAAGVPVAQARTMKPQELRDMAADGRADQRRYARGVITTASQLGGGSVNPASLQTASYIERLSPEQQQQQASFWASGGRGPTPNDIQQQREISERLTPEQRILAEQQRLEAQRAEREAMDNAWKATEEFVNENYASDGVFVTPFNQDEQRATLAWIRARFPFVSEETAKAWVDAIARRKGPRGVGTTPPGAGQGGGNDPVPWQPMVGFQ